MQSDMKWFFPKDGTILDTGTNSLKFDTSDDEVKMFVRELCQNSCDAAFPGKTVEIEFDLFYIDNSDFPDGPSFRTVLERCREATEKLRNDHSAYELMSDMVDDFNRPKIPILRCSDFGTTGATGSNINSVDEYTAWKTMTTSQGISNKSEKSAGSFGRGKNSFFAVSQFHTVFFSTNAVDGYAASVGCSKLITHYDSQGNKYSSFGICGDPNFKNNYSSKGILTLGDYVRSPDRYGTDIYIVGYMMFSDDWDDRIMMAAIIDFFPKILKGDLRIKVGTKYVDNQNLLSVVQDFIFKYPLEAGELGLLSEQIGLLSGEPVFSDGKISLYLGKSERYNQIASVRSGMVIDRHYKSAASMIGLLVVDDDDISKLLSKCEPTNHDKWSKRNIQNVGRGQKTKIVAILDYISDTVTKQVAEFAGFGDGEEQDAEGLEKYLSLHKDTSEQIQVARKEYCWGVLASIKPRRQKKVKKRREEPEPQRDNPMEMMASEQDPEGDFNQTASVDRVNPQTGEAERNFLPDENGDMKRVFKVSSAVKISNVVETCTKRNEGLICTFTYNIDRENEYYVRVSAVMKGGKSAEQVPILKAEDSEGNSIPVIDGFYAGPITSKKSVRNRLKIVLNYPAICDFRPEVFDYAN